jgi:hypothetical protein
MVKSPYSLTCSVAEGSWFYQTILLPQCMNEDENVTIDERPSCAVCHRRLLTPASERNRVAGRRALDGSSSGGTDVPTFSGFSSIFVDSPARSSYNASAIASE